MHWYAEVLLRYAGSAMSDSTEPNLLGASSSAVSTRSGFSAYVAKTGHLLGICVSRLYAQHAW